MGSDRFLRVCKKLVVTDYNKIKQKALDETDVLLLSFNTIGLNKSCLLKICGDNDYLWSCSFDEKRDRLKYKCYSQDDYKTLEHASDVE